MAIKYLSGKRLQGTTAERTALNIASPPATSWKELDRVTLGSAGADLDTGTFSTKDNIMILAHTLPSGTTACDLTFNADSGSNYASRQSGNGGSDGTSTSTSLIDMRNNSNEEHFHVIDVINNASQEKLGISHHVGHNSSGAGNAPNRRELSFKWANTSNQINQVKFNKGSFTNFDSGSELVVLGCDNDEADSGTNFWQELANVELTSTGDDIDSGTFTAKKYLWVQIKTNKTGSPEGKIQFNNDAGANYAERHENNFGTEYTNTSRSWIDDYIMSYGTGGGFLNMFIINESGKEKLAIAQEIINPTGAGNAPFTNKGGFKWANTSAQITSIKLFNTHVGDWTAGSSIKVWGSD